MTNTSDLRFHLWLHSPPPYSLQAQVARRWAARLREYARLDLFRGRDRLGATLIGCWRILESVCLDFRRGLFCGPTHDSSSYSRFGRRLAKLPSIFCTKISAYNTFEFGHILNSPGLEEGS